MITPFESRLRTRVIFGQGCLSQLGKLVQELGFRRTLLVADRGMVATGYVDRAEEILTRENIAICHFHNFAENPNSLMIESGRALAAQMNVDSIIGLGGGSSMDCAKGINFCLTNGGQIQDYLGYGKAAKPMLPMIGVPTTAGTGSEAQSYALISDAETHVKMACGDPKVAFRAALLDPELTVTQPRTVTAISGYDAISHAVESYVSKTGNALSRLFAREAWSLLHSNLDKVLTAPGDLDARAAMQLGAHYAGVAIEHSMLGAAHACANPLTARYGIAHGEAIALMLTAVVRWNGRSANQSYGELLETIGIDVEESLAAEELSERLRLLAEHAGLNRRLSSIGVSRRDLPGLAQEAGEQWTGRFNPRPFDVSGALEVYEWVY